MTSETSGSSGTGKSNTPGNDHYTSFCLLLMLEILTRPRTCGKSVLYIGHFDIQWPRSTQIIKKIPFQ